MNKSTQRTIKIIERGGRILLKRKKSGWYQDVWYLSQWTNIAAGFDKADWSQSSGALEFFNLRWAHTIAPLYDCKVVVIYPKAKKEIPQEVRETIGDLIKRKLKEKKEKPRCPACNPAHWTDRGECTCGRQVRMFEGDSNNPITALSGGDPSYNLKADGSRR